MDSNFFRNLDSGVDLEESRGAKQVWPFMKMEAGDAIEVTDKGKIRTAKSAVQYAKKVTRNKYKTMTTDSGTLIVKRIY